MVEPKLKQRPSNPLDLLMSGMTGAHFEEFSLKKNTLVTSEIILPQYFQGFFKVPSKN